MKIPEQLKSLVFDSVNCLGQVLRSTHGEEVYSVIESTRQEFKKTRNQSDKYLLQVMNQVYESFDSCKKQDLAIIAKSYALMLELINSCEMAYRIFMLKAKDRSTVAPTVQKLIFVFTSHPTEARSKDFLVVMEKTLFLLEEGLESGFDKIEKKLTYNLKIAVRIDLAKNESPTVKDEAQQIYHHVLSPEILSEQISLFQSGIDVGFRTWSGGDKDGHPYVGPVEMKQSLNLSRKKIIEYILNLIQVQKSDFKITKEVNLLKKTQELEKKIKLLKILTTNDGRKVQKIQDSFKELYQASSNYDLLSPSLEEIKCILWLYPALVLPLEIREDSEVIHLSLKDKSEKIAQMLNFVKKVSNGFDPKWYARGLIVSMCQTEFDLMGGIGLVEKYLGKNTIPTVPLFENEKGLRNAVNILSKTFTKYKIEKTHQEKWNNKYEVMLGYSDSSKENGVLSGRIMLEEAVHKIDAFLTEKNLSPVFFHGSGGSISRGGGSTKEQISWWPKSSLNIFKMTVQGESIQRHFSHPIIIRSQVYKIVDEFQDFKPRNHNHSKELFSFASKVSEVYKEITQNKDFQKMVNETTPYGFLNHLKLGSRPSKRNKEGEFSLRAIPWILCWTQTRLLFPVWWGIGSTWKEATDSDREKIKSDFKKSSMLMSFTKHLGFSLEKIEMGVWFFLLEKSKLSAEAKFEWKRRFIQELELTKDFFKDVTEKKDFVWFRPWLAESVTFRSSMIHPLNVIQKIATEKNDPELLRITVTGISSGMLTTG